MNTERTKDLKAARDRYSKALADLHEAEQRASDAIEETGSRIRAAREADERRLDFLKRQIADTPFYELQRINARLAEADRAASQSTAAWMISQYNTASAPAMLHPSDRRRLEDKKRSLERELLHATPTPEQTEYIELSRREYLLTDAERNELAAHRKTLKDVHGALIEARRDLWSMLEAIRAELKPFEDLFEAGGFTTIENAYTRTMDAIDKRL